MKKLIANAKMHFQSVSKLYVYKGVNYYSRCTKKIFSNEDLFIGEFSSVKELEEKLKVA